MQARQQPPRFAPLKTLPRTWSTSVANQVQTDYDLKDRPFRLYWIHRAHAATNGGKLSRVGERTLARELGCSIPSVQRAMAELVRKGLIRRHRKRRHPSHTELVWPLPPPLACRITDEASCRITDDATVPARLALSGPRRITGDATEGGGGEAKLHTPSVPPATGIAVAAEAPPAPPELPAEPDPGAAEREAAAKAAARAKLPKRLQAGGQAEQLRIDLPAKREPKTITLLEARIKRYRRNGQWEELRTLERELAERQSPSEPPPAPDPLGGPAR